MKELFEDFDISTHSNASFNLELDEKGNIQYKLTDVEKESIVIYFEHKTEDVSFELESSGDTSLLKEVHQKYLEVGKDPEQLKEAFLIRRAS